MCHCLYLDLKYQHQKMKLLHLQILVFCLLFLACSNDKSQKEIKISKNNSVEKKTIPFTSDVKTIHVFVALCDNKYQGIVPVPEKIGNGQDPDNNLYWGCAFGVRSYFKKSKEWKFIESRKLKSEKLERIIFKHVNKNYYLIADAYDGKFIKESTIDFLKSSSGKNKDTLKIGKNTIGIGGNSKLLAYVGHDGFDGFSIK